GGTRDDCAAGIGNRSGNAGGHPGQKPLRCEQSQCENQNAQTFSKSCDLHPHPPLVTTHPNRNTFANRLMARCVAVPSSDCGAVVSKSSNRLFRCKGLYCR